MKKVIYFLTIFLALTIGSKATVIQVVSGDNLQTKINNAVAGDILIVGPGSYGTVDVSKRLTLVGPGYSFSGNAPNTGTANINNLYIQGALSNVSGFQMTNAHLIGDNITFSRNFVTGNLDFGNLPGVYRRLTINNKVLQCRINGTVELNDASGPHTNYKIVNCILGSTMNFLHGTTSSGSIVNNIIGGAPGSGQITIENSSGAYTNVYFYNNIFTKPLNTGGNSIFTLAATTPSNFLFNVLVGNGVPEQTIPSANNLINQNQYGILAGYQSATVSLQNPLGLPSDGLEAVLPASAAYTYGRLAPFTPASATTQAGIYGGPEPYVVSGIPVGPFVFQLTVPSVVANNSVVPITIKARSQN